MSEIKDKQISYAVTKDWRKKVRKLAKDAGLNVTQFLDSLINKHIDENHYSLYRDYLKIIDLVEKTLETYETIRDLTDDESSDNSQMDDILNVVYQLLIRSNAVKNDDKNKILIDEAHPLWDEFSDEKPYTRLKFAYSPIDVDAVNSILDS